MSHRGGRKELPEGSRLAKIERHAARIFPWLVTAAGAIVAVVLVIVLLH